MGKNAKRAAFIGIGEVPTGRFPETAAIYHAIESAKLAIRDAGIDKDEIDYVMPTASLYSPAFNTELVTCRIVEELGLKNVNKNCQVFAGGSSSSCGLQLASSLIETGNAKTVLFVHADRLNPWAKPFWDAANEEKLVFQHCKSCNKNIFYPRIACPACFSDDLEWIEASGRGRVYTYTVVESNAPSAFVGDMPYVVAIVKLEEGVQLLSNIVGCNPHSVACEMPVEVVFERLNNDFTLPRFRPVQGL